MKVLQVLETAFQFLECCDRVPSKLAFVAEDTCILLRILAYSEDSMVKYAFNLCKPFFLYAPVLFNKRSPGSPTIIPAFVKEYFIVFLWTTRQDIPLT